MRPQQRENWYFLLCLRTHDWDEVVTRMLRPRPAWAACKLWLLKRIKNGEAAKVTFRSILRIRLRLPAASSPFFMKGLIFQFWIHKQCGGCSQRPLFGLQTGECEAAECRSQSDTSHSFSYFFFSCSTTPKFMHRVVARKEKKEKTATILLSWQAQNKFLYSLSCMLCLGLSYDNKIIVAVRSRYSHTICPAIKFLSILFIYKCGRTYSMCENKRSAFSLFSVWSGPACRCHQVVNYIQAWSRENKGKVQAMPIQTYMLDMIKFLSSFLFSCDHVQHIISLYASHIGMSLSLSLIKWLNWATYKFLYYFYFMCMSPNS